MQKADILLFLNYNSWANGRVLDASAKVSVEEFVGSPYAGMMSLRETLLHTLGAEQRWRTRMEAGVSPAVPRAQDFPNPEALRRPWREEDQAMRAYLATLDDEALEGSFRYRRSSGAMSDALMRWHTLVHVVNHGTQHRSEAASLLTAFGHSPGDLDFGLFLFDRR
ncbi:MAG: DinB family protein [Dehalococcoidia bacterium]